MSLFLFYRGQDDFFASYNLKIFYFKNSFFLLILFIEILVIMDRTQITVEEFREVQDILKDAIDLHEKKDFYGAIESFKKAINIKSFDEGHLNEFQKKLKEGSYKLAQESMAYMGCASVHVSQLVKELTDEQREEVPVDENLIKVFNDWEN